MNALAEQIKLDFRAGEPLYMQIARQVESLVTLGVLKVGDQLPTVRELATELRINFNTVARAYHVLDDQGLISTQRGRGTYIWEQPTEEMMQNLKWKTLEELAKKYLAESQNLGYSAEQAAEMLRQMISAPQQPQSDEEM
ncbi:MAG TPA: GntR family transcriptional regulator [Anaerolineaceae bacterium]